MRRLGAQALAPKRSSSVFPAPLRAILDAASHAEASAIRRGIDGKGMSIQSFAITRKVQEIDLALEAFPLHQSVHEVHPELCFTHLNGGQPMSFSKKTSAGRAERLRILTEDFADSPARLVEERVRRDVGADDVLDALVALWSAIRISRGHACVIAGASGSRCAGSSDGHLLLAHFACVRTRLAVAHERLPQCTCAEQQEQSVITGVSRPSTASMSPRAA